MNSIGHSQCQSQSKKYMKRIYFIIALLAGMVLNACHTVDIPEPQNKDLPSVSNLQHSVLGRDLTLTWELPDAARVPAGLQMVGIEVVKNSMEVTTIDSLCTSYVVKRATVNTEMSYAVRVVFSDGRVSPNAAIIFTIPYEEKARPAMVLLADNINDLESDEERGAAQWFQENYVDRGEGNFIKPADLPYINLNEVSVLWIHLDRLGITPGLDQLPAELTSNAVKAALKSYISNGGNMYLSKHATQLVVAYGRVKDKFLPNIFNAADGAEGSDVWSINANMVGGKYDMRNHAIFAGLTKNSDANTTFPLIGPVYRYDHNCIWDMNALTLSKPGEDKFEQFQKETNSEILATWGHVVDDAVAGIISFKADDDGNFLGTVICNGFAAYNMGNEANTEYQSNNDKLTQNILEYLK